jgi:two-component system, OmpR family, phosphate regulon response regulator PhoB
MTLAALPALVTPDMTERNRAFAIGEPAEWRESVCSALSAVSLGVEPFASGKQALDRLDETVPLIVVAAQTADVSGVALCRRVRELPGGDGVTIIVLSSLCDEMDRVLAFENGADDFVAEPFSARELAARVRAILRRRQQRAHPQPAGEIEAGALRLDLIAGVAEVSGHRVRLTLREFEVLKHLALNGGRVVKRGDLLRALDGEPNVSERLVDTHVKSIRSKLGDARDMIETVRGVGYRFDARGHETNGAPLHSA